MYEIILTFFIKKRMRFIFRKNKSTELLLIGNRKINYQ